MAKFKYPTYQINFCTEKALECLTFVSSGITIGDFNNVSTVKYAVPSRDISKVYKHLILGIAKEQQISIIDALFAAYNSFVSEKIDDYNSS